MKKTLLIIGIILVVILALPVINLIRWTFQTKKPMDIILVDKTVPSLERDHHKSFSWILMNERFVKKESGSSYSYKNDYYGFVPQKPIRERMWSKRDYRLADIIDLAKNNDAIYFTDTYGVASGDWYRSIFKPRKTRKLYGGLNNNDFLLIKEMKERNKLVIMEYNAFDYPTAPYESFRTQDKLGVKFSGWTGKFFSSLDSTAQDFPQWLTAMYRKEYKKQWSYTKSGIVLLTQKDIVVLEEGIHLKYSMPLIVTDSANAAKFNVIASVSFDKWFDIIDPLENKTVSSFNIETTSVGDTLLSINGLSNSFPAVVQDAAERVYYFSGDFASGELPYWTSRFKGVEKLKGIMYSDKPEDTRRFFWLYYRPLITGIFTNYNNSMTK